jgi:hypothetical protein
MRLPLPLSAEVKIWVSPICTTAAKLEKELKRNAVKTTMIRCRWCIAVEYQAGIATSMVLQEWLYKLSQWTLHHLLQNQVERRIPWTHLGMLVGFLVDHATR